MSLRFVYFNPNGSPAAWAGLVLIGDATALPATSFWWWLLGGLGLLTLCWLGYKRQSKFSTNMRRGTDAYLTSNGFGQISDEV
jgi:hypothetical protein